jgi:NAD(P)-dependent dehydrogenase (short-subunit alcohol dehydrogenase family)
MFAVTQAMLPLLKKSTRQELSIFPVALALTQNNDPRSEFAHFILLAYQSSKTAVNALTVILAKELASSSIKINSADPGYTATDLNGHRGYRSLEQAARIIVRLATLEEDGPTGAFLTKMT